MEIDIDKLTEAELTDLNNRIVARLRFLSQMRAHAQMLEFKIGDRVSFQPEGHRGVVGMLTAITGRPLRSSPTTASVGMSRPRSCAWQMTPAVSRTPLQTWLRYAGSDQGAAAEDNRGSRSPTFARG